MKIIKYLLIFFAAIVALFLLLGLVAPREYNVERSVEINAKPEKVFKHVNSLQKMHEWSPWAELDPNMKITNEGPEGQPGSKQSWSGNKEAGKGEQEILAVSNNRVETKIHFIEPFESICYSYVNVVPQSNTTKVTWGFKGENPYPFNALCLLMNMDSMIGKDFDRGLGKLKTQVENE